jgi:FkbM family methyltransferase
MNPLRSAAVSLANAMPPFVARRFRSSGRLATLARPVANLVLPKDRTSVTVRAGRAAGLRLLIDPRVEKYYWSGLYEAEVQEIVATRLASGDSMWDVGAHVGFLSAIAARTVGPTGQVIAFEPFPMNANRLRQTISQNGLGNVTVREVAVSAVVGTSVFYLDPSTSMGSLVLAEGAPWIEVPTTTLDDELERFGPPALVKVDVEGSEDQVIEGGRRLFSEVRPVLVIELLSEESLARAESLLPGYTFSRVDEMNFLGEPNKG